ncbi:hypothetical protein A0256_00195 [Mucilaginibacter sp. PAMC 26640]|nr:hypothetical protein A0256_00195 [Mucilaginibacter sp. PAMC 26640]
MNTKLRKAYLAYQKDMGAVPKGQFFHVDPATNKKSLVKLSHDPQGQLTLGLKSGNQTILASLQNDLNEILATPLAGLAPGNRVVLLASGSAPAPGQAFQLDPQDRYFAVNGGPISCNGQPLNVNCNGRFLGRFSARCFAQGATQNYDEFRLI